MSLTRRMFTKATGGGIALSATPPVFASDSSESDSCDTGIQTTTKPLTWMYDTLESYIGPENFQRSPTDGVYTIPRDTDYRLPETEDDFAKLAAAFELFLTDREYVADEYDCEDFAMKFATMAAEAGLHVGMMYQYSTENGAAHMFNVAVCGDGSVVGYEPQPGGEYDEEIEIYQPTQGVLIV